MSQRVTLDHPSMGGRGRHSTSRNHQSEQPRAVPVDSMMVSRARQARAQQPQTSAHNPKVATSRVARHTQPAPPPKQESRVAAAEPIKQHYVKATERVLGGADVYAEAPKTKGWRSSWKSHSIYGMAVMLFVVGMGVAASGFVSTTKANEQIEAIGEVLESGDEQAINRLGSALPSEDPVAEVDISQYTVAPEQPRYIRIPSIGVGTTRVLNTGLTADNEVDVPKGIYDTSWYNGSAKITDEKGAMFVVGHYVGPNKAGIFFNLEDMKKGNIVEIEQGDGTKSFFKVVEITDYSIDNVDMVKSLAPADPDKLGLNLMTCGGGWDVGIQKYDRRTLVRTVKI